MKRFCSDRVRCLLFFPLRFGRETEEFFELVDDDERSLTRLH